MELKRLISYCSCLVLCLLPVSQAASHSCYEGREVCKDAPSTLINGNRIRCCLRGQSMEATSQYTNTFGRSSEYCKCSDNSIIDTSRTPTADSQRLALEARRRQVGSFVDSLMSDIWGSVGRMWSSWMAPSSIFNAFIPRGNLQSAWDRWRMDFNNYSNNHQNPYDRAMKRQQRPPQVDPRHSPAKGDNEKQVIGASIV